MTNFQFGKQKEKLRNCFNFQLTRKSVLIIILLITIIGVLDSFIVTFSTYVRAELPVSVNLAIFFSFFILFIITNVIMINSVRRSLRADQKKLVKQLTATAYFHSGIVATLTLSTLVILIIILQIILTDSYAVNLLGIQSYISHLSPILFLTFLIFWFVRWMLSSKSPVILCYCVSISLLSVNLLISLAYLQLAFFSSSALEVVKSFPIYSYVIMYAEFPITSTLYTIFYFLSLISFLFMWIATAILLKQYRHKMGELKYFVLVGVPLLYYIFPFQRYFGDLLFPLMMSAPLVFSLVYVLAFSATRQVGALLFSLSFWTASNLVYEDRVRKSVLIASVGIAILFGSTGITPLQYTMYPPYGLISEAFLPIGAYLLSIGIFVSAKSISEDINIRREFYKSAASQLSLLKSIGVSQMEKEFESKVRYLEKRTRSLDFTPFKGEILDERRIKEILRDVLDELYNTEKKTEKT